MPFRIYQSPTARGHCECPLSRIFCDLPEAALRDFESLGMQMHLPKGAVLFQEGDLAGGITVLCEGQIKLQSTSREGKIVILKIAMPGDILGLGAVLSETCHEMTAGTLEPTTVKNIRKDEFLSFLNRHAQASMYAARVLSEGYKSAFFDACSLTSAPSAAGRLASILLDLSRGRFNDERARPFTMALTHEELANLTGTSRETVTRMLSRFKRERWIQVDGSSMTILAWERLLQLVSPTNDLA